MSGRHTSQGGRWAPLPAKTRRVGIPQSKGGASGAGPEKTPCHPQSCLGSQSAGKRKAKVMGARKGEAWEKPGPAPQLSLPEQRAGSLIDTPAWKACFHLHVTSSQIHKHLSLAEDVIPPLDCITLFRHELLHLCVSCEAPPGWRQKSYSLNS